LKAVFDDDLGGLVRVLIRSPIVTDD